MLYTIEEETLNGLADAVRLKDLGQVELPILSVENQYIIYNDVASYELKGEVRKIKIIGRGEYSSGTTDGILGLGIAPGKFDKYMADNVRKAEGYVVIKEYDDTANDSNKRYNFDFEITIEGNSFTFVTDLRSNLPRCPYISFEAIGLDENGNAFEYTPLEMIDKINGFSIVPETAYKITGDCSDRFSSNGWNWFIEDFGNKITTKGIMPISSIFEESNKLTEIPFDLNIADSSHYDFNRVFYNNNNLLSVPNIIGPERKPQTGSYSNSMRFKEMFYNCYRLREIPYDYFWKIAPNADYWESTRKYTEDRTYLFYGCYSLRKLPDISILKNSGGRLSTVYYNGFNNCACLDEMTNLPVYNYVAYTSNMFNNSFNSCNRLKELIFETNEDGTPKTAQWKSQTINLAEYVGYTTVIARILNYNSGITADKEVKDDATYQALKDDPDWFSCDINYSRYNRTSAVNTINSLPDTSAYGTNTISFKGASGALTDGGAINTLTEEEIAVAAAKGWTVSLV